MADSDDDNEELTSKASTSRKQSCFDLDEDVSSSTESEHSEKHNGNSKTDTGFGASISLDTNIDNVMHLQKQLQNLQRQLDRETRNRVSSDNKCQSLETQKTELSSKLTVLTRDKRTLEEIKIDLEAKLRSVQVSLATEQQKRANAELMVVRTKEQLSRHEEQGKIDSESKQKLEILVRSLRNQLEEQSERLYQVEAEKDDAFQQLEANKASWLQTTRNDNLEAVSSVQEAALQQSTQNAADEEMSRDAAEKIQQLTAELAMVKLELEQRINDDEDKQRIVEENELLLRQVDKLREDLELDTHTLSEQAVKYNVEIGILKGKLEQALMDTEKYQSELEQSKMDTASRIRDLEQAQKKCVELESQMEERQAQLIREMDHCNLQLTKAKEENELQAKRLAETELKLLQMESQLKVLTSDHGERSSAISEMQKQLSIEQAECERLREKLRTEQEANMHLQAKIDILQDKVSSLHEETVSLKRSADESQTKNGEQSERLMSVIATLQQDHQLTQSELEEKKKELESLVEDVTRKLNETQRERDSLRSELEEARCALDENSLKLTSFQTAKDTLERERMELQNQLERSSHQLELALNKQNEMEVTAQQMTTNLEAAESSSVDYMEALRTKQADLEAALQLLANNNEKLTDVANSPQPVRPVTETVLQPVEQKNDPELVDSQGRNFPKQSRPAEAKHGHRASHRNTGALDKHHKKHDMDREEMERQIAGLKVNLHSANRRLKRPNSKQSDDDVEQLRKQLHQLMGELQRLHAMQKEPSHEVQSQQPSYDIDGMRAELEAKIRMELNKKLAHLNAFLNQHANQCYKIDQIRDANEAEIRQQCKQAERELREALAEVYTMQPTRPSVPQATVVATTTTNNNNAANVAASVNETRPTLFAAGDDIKSSSVERRDFSQTQSLELRDLVVDSHNGGGGGGGAFSPRQRDDLLSVDTRSVRPTNVKTTDFSPDNEAIWKLPVDNRLPLWLQQQLDRSIAKHLEAAPQTKLVPARYSAKNRNNNQSLSTSSTIILDHQTSGYKSVLERHYLLV